jgi:UPF0176 protein
MFVVATLYKFVDLPDCHTLRTSLYTMMDELELKGTIILAHEGINGTIAGSRKAIDQLLRFFALDARFRELEYKESLSAEIPFKLLKVCVKKEIVTLKEKVDMRQNAGIYVDAKAWNELLLDPTVTVIDVRNNFEVALGSFKNAINPKTKAFSDFPAFVKTNLSPALHKKIAMSCTGGIRCEKASSLMKAMGFNEVFQLKGGILQYLHDTPIDHSLWHGQCFVFDERIALDHTLRRSSI